jgi:serine/threonine protein kinase
MDGKGKRFRFFLPKRKINEDEVKKSRSIIRSLKQSRPPAPPSSHRTTTKTISAKEASGRGKNVFLNQSIKFLSNFTSSHIVRKKFGVQRIVQELQRSTVDYETYGSFFLQADNWMITPVPEMDLIKGPGSSGETYKFEPECLLGVGGQGCVFLGRFIDSSIQGSYAFKIRMRTKSAIHSGTTSSPGRRRSPGFRNIEGEIREEQSDNDSEGGKRAVNFIDDNQQESLHREAVAAFRVYSQSKMKPQPLMYGYNAKLDFEIFVMEIMDFTLNDFIKGTTWKARMDCLGEVWLSVKEGFDNCSQSGIVHYDIKPENLGIRISKDKLESGLLDFGISKSQGYSLEKFIKGAKIHRAPGTVTYMSPRTHLWKPMSWMDDFMTSFFSMFVYSTAEGKSSFEKLPGVKKFRSPLSPEDRKHISPESLAVYCLRNPPWTRFPYGSVQALKKKQNESVAKEEISLAMLKVHAMTHPTKIDDIISIILNIDGFLDDTVEMQNIQGEDGGREFANKAAQTLQTILVKQMGKFYIWWLEFAMEVRRLIDQFWETTEESYREKSYQTILKLVKNNIANPDDVIGLVNDSSYGRKLIESNFE